MNQTRKLSKNSHAVYYNIRHDVCTKKRRVAVSRGGVTRVVKVTRRTRAQLLYIEPSRGITNDYESAVGFVSIKSTHAKADRAVDICVLRFSIEK